VKFTSENDRPRVLPTELTPLVDVVFLLIVFFLTTSSLVELTKADVELPVESGEDDRSAQTPGLIINITEEGTYIVDNLDVSLQTLLAMVAVEIDKSGGSEQVDVLVRADKRADLLHVNALAEGLIGLDLSRWRLATEVPRGGNAP
jgi:biopolymer transport protein ExbD